MMNDSIKQIEDMRIFKTIEFPKNLLHGFVNILFDLQEVCFGNEDAWSVCGLVLGAVSDLCQKLNVQTTLPETTLDFISSLSTQDVYQALYNWNWSTGEWSYEEVCPMIVQADIFVALPMGIELFDGENAYLIYNSNNQCRLIWHDNTSDNICEALLDWKNYLKQWKNLESDLEYAMQ